MKIETPRTDWDSMWRSFERTIFFKPNYAVTSHIAILFRHGLREKMILEVGSGSGSDSIVLSSKGAECCVLDYSMASMEVCNKLCQDAGLKLSRVLADCRYLPFKAGAFDLVFSVGLLEHFDNPFSVIREQVATTKEGGYNLVDVPQTFSLWTLKKNIWNKIGKNPYGHELSFTTKELARIAQTLNLKVVQFYGRGSSLTFRLPKRVRRYWDRLFGLIEGNRFGPFLCLNLGMISIKPAHYYHLQ